MLDLESIEGASPVQLARAIRDVLIRSQAAVERYAHLDELLLLTEAGDEQAWERLAAAMWSHEGLYAECDAIPGLRSRVRRAAVGQVLDAIGALIIRAIRQREDEYAQAITIADGCLWIPDAVFPPFVFFLELNPFGLSPCWDERLSDLVEQPGGASAVWRQWLAWVGQNQAVRGYVAMPGMVGSLPATGIPERLPMIRPLAAAVRAYPSSRPILVVDRPVLLPWGSRDIESIDQLVARARSMEERRAISVPWTPGGYRAAMAADPTLAIAAVLARTGQRRPVAALVDLVHRGVTTMAAVAQRGTDVLRAAIPGAGPSPVRIAAWQDRLLVDLDGLAAVVTWLGLFPKRYAESPRDSTSWDYATLHACGWSAMVEARRWDVVSAAGAHWIAFPPGSAQASMPQVAGVEPVAYQPTGTRMALDFPWTPPDL